MDEVKNPQKRLLRLAAKYFEIETSEQYKELMMCTGRINLLCVELDLHANSLAFHCNGISQGSRLITDCPLTLAPKSMVEMLSHSMLETLEKLMQEYTLLADMLKQRGEDVSFYTAISN